MTIKCIHNDCDGELEPYENLKRENAILFKCNKCQCIFTLTSVTKAVGCPSLKETKTKSLNASDASIKRRGGPRMDEELPKLPFKAEIEVPSKDSYQGKLVNIEPLKRGRGRPKGSKNKK